MIQVGIKLNIILEAYLDTVKIKDATFYIINSTQLLYDLGFSTITGARQLNPFTYFKSLENISQRKSQYPSFDKFIIKKENKIPYKDFFVVQSNMQYKTKISNWRKKPVIPKINTIYLELDKRIKNNKEKIKQNEKRALTLENNKYNIRVRSQKPKLLKANYLQKLYTENHDKYLELLLRNTRFRKNVPSVNNIKNSLIRLPNISGYKDGMFTKLRSRTEYNLDNENNDNSDNSVEQKDHKHKEISHHKQGYNDNQNY